MRYLNLGIQGRAFSQAVYHAIVQEAHAGDAITLVTVSPDKPYVCVGYHQLANREIRRQYCEAHDIMIGRRMVGGGAVYLDTNQVFWHLILPGKMQNVMGLYDKVLTAPVAAYQKMGINARHRPINDIVVGPRKIGGTGAATMFGNTVVVGSILMDFDIAMMAQVLNVPSEKFRDKMVSSLSEYMTTVNKELGEQAPPPDVATKVLVETFAELLEEEIALGELTVGEREAATDYETRLFDPSFVFHGERGLIQPGVKVRDGVRVLEGLYKARGGLIRFTYRQNDEYLEEASLSGDFFMNEDGQRELEHFCQSLEGKPADVRTIEDAVRELFQRTTIYGVDAEDVVAAFTRAETSSGTK